jgi:hypothetical protein
MTFILYKHLLHWILEEGIKKTREVNRKGEIDTVYKGKKLTNLEAAENTIHQEKQ